MSCCLIVAASLLAPLAAPAAQAEIKDLAINGGIQDGKARLVIDANLTGLPGDRDKAIFATALEHRIQVGREKHTHTASVTFSILQGEPKELVLTLSGEGEIRKVTGDQLLDWSVRQETNQTRSLVLRPRKTDKPLTELAVVITAERDLRGWSNPVQPLAFAPPQPALFNGYVKIETAPELQAQPTNTSGVVPLETKFLPDSLRAEAAPDAPEPLAFRFHGSAYAVPLIVTLADPEAGRVVLRDFQLQGQITGGAGAAAAFTVTAQARVKDPRGRALTLLSGDVALAEMEPHPDWRVRIQSGQFVLVFDKPGDYAVRLRFNAAVRQTGGWNRVNFRVAPTALQPITLAGLAADTQFEFSGAARPERAGDVFRSFLPPDGTVKLAWKETRPEAEGRLFYAAGMLAQISVSPGLMRQVALVEGKVMQGELNRVVLLVRGQGNVTAVQGGNLLSWTVEPGAAAGERRLVVQFNQPQKDTFTIQVQMQTELGAFPQAVDAMQLRPEGATRFAGHVRVVNEGAVRLEVVQAAGLSQVSPEQFPETDLTKAWLGTQGSQRFAFRFASADFALRINADNVLPEVSVSGLLAYHLGETELAIDAEFELDIREAPLREVLLRVPKGYALARLNAAGLGDYFLREPADQPDAELRLVYGQPIADRQVIQLRLERNGALGQPVWTLPRVEVLKTKSTRGHVAVSADPGFRLTPDRTAGLTDIATAFFPRKVTGIQAAFRLAEPAWEAALRVERLPQSIQADVFHLFSIGEGIAYGSSTMNFFISGAPVSSFVVSLSEEYFNIEFTGRDLRSNWQRTTNGYLVTLNTPVSGPYTLLVTYERPFKAQGDTLTFTGARPVDAQSEQGHTLVVSAYQFQVNPANISPGLLELETGEVPSEYRLFFDAPILKAYRYNARPFNLQLALTPLQQYGTLGLVVDRASFQTRISKDGEVVTDATYFVKNRGNPHFKLALPADTTLWSVTVNGATVVPVKDAGANLIPLPQRADPNAVQTLQLKLASKSKTPGRVTTAVPIVTAPVLLAEWRVEPDTGQRLTYRGGSLAPAAGVVDASGFAGLARLFQRQPVAGQLALALALVAFAVWAWRWAVQPGTHRFSVRHVGGAVVGALAVVLAATLFATLLELAARQVLSVPRGLTFLAPVQQGGSALVVEVGNVRDEWTFWRGVGVAWPALFAFLAWVWAWINGPGFGRNLSVSLGWTLAAWAALRWPNGTAAFVVVLLAFLGLHVVLPALRPLFKLPRKPSPPPSSDTGTAATAPVTALLVLGAMLGLGLNGAGASSADFQSAVSPSSTRQAVLTSVRSTQPGDPVPSTRLADFKSAIQQSSTLRYGQPSTPLLLAQATPADPKPVRATAAANSPFPRLIAPPLAESVVQDIRVEDKFALATATIRWQAQKDQLLPLVFEPAVVTRVNFPAENVKLVQTFTGGKRVHQLLALQDGRFDIEVQYQLHVGRKDGESGFTLPTAHGLVNRLTLTLTDIDADVASPAAVAVERAEAGADAGVLRSNAVFKLVLAPVNDAWIGWKPRSRDVRREKAVFYAELSQLYAPAAGVLEGVHLVQIRPAQGELGELIFDVPGGATITDVIDAAKAGPPLDAKNAQAPGTSIVSLWRFDPDTRKLRVTLNPPQSRPFIVLVRSQIAAGTLPFDQNAGVLSVNGAAGQLGSLGLATGNEVQLDTVTAEGFAAINLEDFPPGALQPLRAQIAGLTLRRAFRYTDPKGTVALRASAVEPDVRVETQETLSLGEDRTVLAANVTVAITRAGIFRLSFLLATNLDVEGITGPALSHWTELKAPEGRIITLHLKGRTEGQQQFNVNLAGPGTKSVTNYAVPRLTFREATKQRGQLVIVPEQGMRLQVGARDGVTQLDPQKSGIRQKGVLAFRLLQPQWTLGLDIEQVDAWVQVTSLQHVSVSEAQVKVSANLMYQIENTGLKALRVIVPTNAEGVRFRGEQVADFLPVPGTVTNGMQAWEVKLHRRLIGRYLLQASWQTPVPTAATNVLVRGVQAADANLQRGFVTVQSSGRLQVRVDAPPAALQGAEWQGIPRALLQDIPAASANHTFRLVESAFVLPLTLERHEAARLLAARVNNVTLTSVISDEGVMLTQVKLEVVPGDKRLLQFTLPPEAGFWFAFVNQNGVWPWREQSKILIPLEQQSRPDQPVTVELFYSSRITGGGRPASGRLDLSLLGPKVDLPLENITWQVYLNDKWHLADWGGTLQLQEEATVMPAAVGDVKSYLENEQVQNRAKTKVAEEMLSLGNTLLERGDPQQARRAFQSAYGLSTHDQAFNEDARVQLHNLKLQQALIGLNVRQNAAAGEAAPAADNLKQLRARKDVAYTQQEAKQILDANPAADNDALMRVAERIVQQQDAAVIAPAAIRASVPQQGRLLTFRRTVQVDPEADLRLALAATAKRAASGAARLGILLGVFLALGFLGWFATRGNPAANER